jgi:hypothetical protein
LASLSDEGLVNMQVIRARALDMKIYQISAAGKRNASLALHPTASRGFCEPFLIQVYFGGLLSDEEFIQLLENEIRA